MTDGDPAANSGTTAVDFDLPERIGRRLRRSGRFRSATFRPEHAPDALVVEYDRNYFPSDVRRVTLGLRWFRNDDVNLHYAERYRNDECWECRWDRHPNPHGGREHFHPPPDASTPVRSESYPNDWRDVLTEILGMLDEHVRSHWREDASPLE